MDFALLTEGRTRSLEPPFYMFRFKYLNESILGDGVKIADLAIKVVKKQESFSRLVD